jgi:hypothetical protein
LRISGWTETLVNEKGMRRAYGLYYDISHGVGVVMALEFASLKMVGNWALDRSFNDFGLNNWHGLAE